MSRLRNNRKRPAPPPEVVTAHVDDLAHDGRGVAHLQGKAVFIAEALPGEDIQFHYT